MFFLQKLIKSRNFPAALWILGFFALITTCTTESSALQTEIVDISTVSPSEGYARFLETEVKNDPELVLMRNPDTKSVVIDYYARVSNRQVAQVILRYCDIFDIPPALAFALAREESRYNRYAVNTNSNSIDRGLFQLNSKSFPTLSDRDFFDPSTNARFGLAHLSFCLKTGGNEVSALAMYNAGTNRVSMDGTPRKTLDYVSRILKYRGEIESDFALRVTSRHLGAFAKTER